MAQTLKSVEWADEILVVDSGSSDASIAECEKYENCKVVTTPWLGFGKTHHFGVESAKFDNIFNVDQDEVVTDALKEKILTLLAEGELDKVYRIKRETFYLTKIIKHCWSGDYPTRVFNRKYANFVDEAVPHEYVVSDLPAEKIQELLVHKCYPSLNLHLQKINFYTENGAKFLHKKGKKSGLLKAFFHGGFMFFKMFFLRLGFLDGKVGFVLSLNSAFYVYLKYIKLWQFGKGAGLDG